MTYGRVCESILTAGNSCLGHLGKFDSCRDEGLYELSMDANETTGTTEFRGHFSRVIVATDEWVEVLNDFTVLVPAGDYVVECASSGAVSVYDYDERSWKLAETAYEGWDSQEWCDDCSSDKRCEIHELMVTDPGAALERIAAEDARVTS